MSKMFTIPFRPAFDANGRTIPGAQAYFTVSGTNTPAPVFTDAAMTVPATNPVSANGVGRFPKVYLDEGVTYRVRIYGHGATPGSDTPLEDYDPYAPVEMGAAGNPGPAGPSAYQIAVANGFTGTEAEWLESLEGGLQVTGGIPTVASRVDIAKLSGSNAAAILREGGKTGLFRFDPSDLSALSAADINRDIVVPPQYQDGSNGAWVRQFDGPLNLAWFLDPNRTPFVTDDLPAMNVCLAVSEALLAYGKTVSIYIPGGRYYFSDTVNVHHSVRIYGDGSAQNSIGFGTRIRFGKNCNGFVFNYFNTHGDEGYSYNAYGTAATSATLEGVQIWGGNVNVNSSGDVTSYKAGDSTTGHGVRIRTLFVTLKDVHAQFFGGDGFNVNATAGAGGSLQGNANSFYLERCQAEYNRGNGYFFVGADANAGMTVGCSAISCGGSGFKEYSFLGNTHIQPHVRDCGIYDPVSVDGLSGPVGTCVHGGVCYYVVARMEAQASTTEPGTNVAIWAPFKGYSNPYCRPWVSGQTWVVGVPYVTSPTNFNGRSVFVGPYAEAAQGAVQITFPTLALGGLLQEVGIHDSQGSNAGVYLNGESGVVNAKAFRAGNNTFGGQNQIFEARPTTDTFRLKNTVLGGKGAIRADINNQEGAVAWVWYGPESWFPNAFVVNHLHSSVDENYTNARRIGFISSLPSLNGKSRRRGDVHFNANASVGSPVGWIATSDSANAGANSAPFGIVGSQQAAALDPATATVADIINALKSAKLMAS